MNEPNSTETSLVGQQLGDYEILRRLGRGGMAEVYLAQQQSLGRKVAVKILRPDFANDENYVRRFQNEARNVASLVHANIVQIYEVGCIGGYHFLAQEYVPGQTLKQLVARTGPLDVRRAVSILRQVAAALDRAGNQKMVHRDIKPENILLTPTGEAKVADFGLARVISDNRNDMTQIGMTMGTPLYMSPEQVEGRPVDGRSDIYSCGVMAFYMLAGQPPFDGDTALAIAVQHLQKQPPSLHEFRSDLPEGLSEIVAKMLQKDPADRFDSGGEILRAFRVLKIAGLHDVSGHHDDLITDEILDGDQAEYPSQLDATMQLQSLMATQAMVAQRRQRFWLMPALIVGALLIGGLAARTNWSGPILAVDSQADVKIEDLKSPKKQFVNAKFAPDEQKEAAFRAVWEYNPAGSATGDDADNYLWMLRAKQHLGMFYLNDEPPQREKAAAIFEELANLNEVEVEARTIGLAGQALLFQMTGDDQKARDKLMELWPNRTLLEDEIRQGIERAADVLFGPEIKAMLGS